MSRIAAPTREERPDLERYFGAIESRMGFLPNSTLAMANVPGMVEAISGMARVIYSPDAKTPLQLRNLVGQIASQAAGCTYCTAHSASNAAQSGIEDARIAAVWDFETSPLFSPAEKAAFHFALAAGVHPNAVTDELVEDLGNHYDAQEMSELMAVIAWFGLLNRWNDSMATPLEDYPLVVARRTLTRTGWRPGAHDPDWEPDKTDG